MTSEATVVTTPSVLPVSVRARILLYLGGLIFLLNFGAPFLGLIDVPISFFLKNKLHLSAHEVAMFRLVASVPLYVSFLFGFARDVFNPFGMRDRGYMMLFGVITALVYVYFAFADVGYTMLVFAVALSTIAFLFVNAAQAGLTSALGQRNVMSGQVATMWNIVQSLPVLAAYWLGGIFSDMLEGQNAGRAARLIFLTGAAVMLSIAVFAIGRPRVVYDHLHDTPKEKPHPFTDMKRLLAHWPVYPALAIWFMWSFAPGSVTPLQYYLQNTLHSNDAQWGEWNAIFAAAFIPTYLLFGYLCRKYPLRTLLLWGTAIGVPQFIPLLFVHSTTAALLAAVPIGLMGGVATAAYYDLMIRSCPRGLEGTVLMMSIGLYYIAGRFGDLLGTTLYDRFGGFGICVAAITITYALILPTILLVPRGLIATPDGEVPNT